MLARVDSLEVLAERMALPAAAEELGLRFRTTELTPVLPSLPDVGRVDAAIDWVFEERPPVGEASPVLENERFFYVVELLSRQDARTLTLDEARSSIRTILVRERQRDRTRDIGRQLADRIRGGATLEAAGAQVGIEPRATEAFTRLDFVPGIGQANAAVGAAFGLGVGETSGLISTPDAFFIVQVLDREDADREAWLEQRDRQRQQVLAALQSRRIEQYLEGLRETARIVDQRDRVLTRGAAS
jgi:peptidyl-prolyl cis-trans isomerase D